jgi:hypothetical protein
MDVDMLIRFARARTELEAVADLTFNFFEDFSASEGADFDVADIAAVVNREPTGGEALDGAGEGHCCFVAIFMAGWKPAHV